MTARDLVWYCAVCELQANRVGYDARSPGEIQGSYAVKVERCPCCGQTRRLFRTVAKGGEE